MQKSYSYSIRIRHTIEQTKQRSWLYVKHSKLFIVKLWILFTRSFPKGNKHQIVCLKKHSVAKAKKQLYGDVKLQLPFGSVIFLCSSFCHHVDVRQTNNTCFTGYSFGKRNLFIYFFSLIFLMFINSFLTAIFLLQRNV